MEPSHIEISEMSEFELFQLLERRSTSVNRPMSTFKQTSVYPPGGFLIEFDPHKMQGQMSTYGLNLSEVWERIVEKSDNYCHHKTGYSYYCSQNIPRSRSVLIQPSEWDQMAEQCMNHINNAIYHHHGIMHSVSLPFQEAPIKHTIFHVCDYITMMALPNQNIEYDRIIQLRFLPCQTDGATDDFQEHIKDFMRLNLDYFFLTFAIWDNNSELPISLRPPKDIMPKAHSMMENSEFIRLQKLKHDALRFRFWSEHGDNLSYQANLVYRNVPTFHTVGG